MITLKADGKFYHKRDDSKKLDEVPGDLIPHLNDAFEIEEGSTFGQFMTHIFHHYQTYGMVFSSHLGHYPLGYWLEDFDKSPTERKDMDYLEVRHSGVSLNISGKKDSYLNDAEIYDEFHGIGDWDEDSGADPGTKGGIAIEYTSLRELKNYPLKLNTEFVVTNAQTFDVVCKMEKYFTVYDVISAILYEISWAGPPTNRDVQWKRIIADVKKSREELDKGNLEKFSTAEEMFARLDKRIEELKKKNE